MKRLLLLFYLIALLSGQVFSQTLYSNTNQSGYTYGSGTSAQNNPIIDFDDVNIANTSLAGKDTVRITKLKIGIGRYAGAPATAVNLYYTIKDDTAVNVNNLIKIPPVLLGTFNLPANGFTYANSVLSIGDSVATLFKLKVDTNNLFSGYYTFFVGISFSTGSTANGVVLASGGPNYNALWKYDADANPSRQAYNFNGIPAAFYIQVFGRATSGPLPITLSSFSGERNGKTNILNWTTATETNNTGFELQRSADGINFSRLDFIASKAAGGNSNATNTYRYSDEKPLAGNGYYRLKQIDKDGKSTTSNTVLIKGLPVSTLTVNTIYPNPVKNSLNIVVANPAETVVTLTIADFSGKILSSQTKQLIAGENRYQLNTAALATGNYLLKVTDSKGETVTQRFTKQ